jgi:hypothetical protein
MELHIINGENGSSLHYKKALNTDKYNFIIDYLFSILQVIKKEFHIDI